MSEAATEQLEAWVREEFRLGPDATVQVREQECGGTGCAPRETAIEVSGAGEEALVLTIHKPIDEVDRLDVLAALAFGGH